MTTIFKEIIPDFLKDILKRGREDLEQRKERILPNIMKEQAEKSPRPILFTSRFKTGEINIIAELKKASPSKGMIRSDLDCGRLASEFEKNGAAALSVLTEEHYFLGSANNLVIAAKNTDLPILRKDFIYDEYQIDEARSWGASAVLLIAAILSQEHLCRLTEYAHSRDLSVLGEAHHAREIKLLLDAPVDMIGVNARDLRTFETSLSITSELLPMIPPDRFPIAESAIQTHDDICLLKKAGASAFLVGETLMRSPDPGRELNRLLK